MSANPASYDWDAHHEGEHDEWVLVCGYEGCCMPGYHFRSECHNADDMEAYYAACEAERATEPQSGVSAGEKHG